MIRSIRVIIQQVFFFFCSCTATALAADRDGSMAFSVNGGPGKTIAAILFLLLAAVLLFSFRCYAKTRLLKAEVCRLQRSVQQARDQQKSMSDIFRQLNDYVFSHDMAGNFCEYNSTGQPPRDYSEAELKLMNIKDLIPAPFKSEADDYLKRIRAKGMDRGYIRIVDKSGSHRILEYNNSVIYDNSGSPIGVRGIARNITEQIKARKALAESEKKYRNILESIEDGYYEVDLKGNYEFVNDALARMVGYTNAEMRDKNYKALVVKDYYQTVFDTFNYVYRTGKPVKALHWEIRRKDGSICHAETSVSLRLDEQNQPNGFQGILRDITARIEAYERQKELEAQLHQAQKMESIGTLAGGIAHDFNNILFPIIGYTELTMQELPSDGQLYAYMEKVQASANRAKALIRQILAFSRQRTQIAVEPEYIQPVIKETLKLLTNTVPATISIQSNIQENTGKVMIDLSMIHQVIMNLCTNAYQAMQDAASGLLKVDLEEIVIDEKNAPLYNHLTPCTYIRIRVSDTGSGFEPEIGEQIFDPYFSTKPKDKGTGLGLSISYGIIKNAGGLIVAHSQPGEGSRFDVFLPVSEKFATQNLPEDHCGPLPCGNERILLIDDEQQILELEKQTLEKLGYFVTAFSNSIEALEVFIKQPSSFDLLVTDQTMPNISGLELVKKLHRIRPHLPVILCTGYSEKIIYDKARAAGIQSLLVKPIASRDMALTLRQVLDVQPETV